MCRHSEGFYRGPSMVFVCCVEFFVLIASCYAVSRHLSDNGGEWGDLFLFHISHVMFCLFFGIYHVVTITHPEICYCDPFNITYLVYVTSFAAMLEIFLRYWKRVTTKPNTKREYWQIRTCIYIILMICYISYYLIMIVRHPCHILDGLIVFQSTFVIVAVVDLLILYFQVRARAKELTQVQQSQSAIRESYLFLAIPMSILLALGIGFTGDVVFLSLGQLFYWLLPSMLMLKITWRRDYLGFFDEINNNEVEWQINELRRFDSEAKRRNTSTASDKSIDYRAKSKSIFRNYFTSAEQHSMNLLSLLTQAPPLNSHIVIRGDYENSLNSSSHGSSFRILRGGNRGSLLGSMFVSSETSGAVSPQTPPSPLTPSSPLKDEVEPGGRISDLAASGGNSSSDLVSSNSLPNQEGGCNANSAPWLLIIDEDLRPSSDHCILVSAIVSGIFLKPLELAFKAHKSRIETLLRISRPRVSVALGDLEKHRQFAELKTKANELTLEFELFLKNCRHLALPVGIVEGNYVSSFKSTVNKKSQELALYTTNLNTHLSLLTRTFQGIGLEETTASSALGVKSMNSSASSLLSSASASRLSDRLASSSHHGIASSPVQGLRKKLNKTSNTSLNSSSSTVTKDDASTLPLPEDESMLVSTITFGAPCGHALGFKQGGIRKLFHKLEVECSKSHKTPQATLNFMHLRFQAKAREAVVLSQGIGALVIASIDILSRCVANKDKKLLKQFKEIGLLIHSVLMLSTHGHEECMIDDFAGAYERLHVTLQIVGPPKEKTVGFKLEEGGGEKGGGRGTRASGRAGDSLSSYSIGGLSLGSSLSSSFSSSKGGAGALNQLHDAEEKWKKLLNYDSEGSGGSSAGSVFKVVKVDKKEVKGLEEFDQHTEQAEEAFIRASTHHQEQDQTDQQAAQQQQQALEQSEPSRKKAESQDIENSSHGKMASGVFGGSMKTSSAGYVTVALQVSQLEQYQWMSECLGEEPEIDLVPNLFNLGVNELQSIANTTGSTQMQTLLNREGLAVLTEYYKKFINFNQQYKGEDETGEALPPPPPSLSLSHVSSTSSNTSYSSGGGGSGWRRSGASSNSGSSSGLPQQHRGVEHIEDMLKLLSDHIEDEAIHKTKNVELLLTSCEIARLMNGARTTSCKSAKDRTSVFQSLEIARIAQRKGWLHKSRETELLEELRGLNGVRLRNCELNIGRPKYSFNQLQLQALPTELRPPHATCTGGKS